MWHEITYAFSNFNGAVIEVFKWILGDFISHLPGVESYLIHVGIKIDHYQ